MTRPEIVRADTLDLQDPVSPSAKDHSRQPASPKPLGDGPPAPHQAQSLRKASLDGYDLNVRSPRGSKDLSDKELRMLHETEGEDHDEGLENGHSHDQEMQGQEMMDDDEEDLEDDDMLDKISSSPSIEDGVYKTVSANTSPTGWPRRSDSLSHHKFQSNGVAGLSDLTGLSMHRLRPLPQEEGNVYLTLLGETRQDRTSSTESENQVKPVLQPTFTGAQLDSDKVQNGEGVPACDEENAMIQSQDLSGGNPNLREDRAEAHSVTSSHDEAGDEEARTQAFDRSPDSPNLSLKVYDSDSGFDSDSVDEGSSDSLPPSVDDDDPELWQDERFIDSGWGGECLREIEDIDFEFVYALHTFVATVEGQANAMKGDTMVLLDDSNSYWWLVKVVKDNSIGYLPAEHIETPTERLARLNKHRNIDLSQTMLGDNPEKSRNPLKIAMRRRNAKTVQFTDPTYYEPSEPSYSSDEEEDDLMSPVMQQQQHDDDQAHTEHNTQQSEDEAAIVSPLRTSRRTAQEGEAEQDARSLDSGTLVSTETDKPRSSQDTLDSKDDDGKKGRGHTDSFFKETETRKINLTPSILRDEKANTTTEESRASLDSQKSNEKNSGKEEKPKKEKEKKKSGGVLSGLFKRKNSKSKHDKEEEQQAQRDDLSGTTAGVSPQPSTESLSNENAAQASPITSPQAKPGKLQKAQKSSLKRGQQAAEDAANQKAAASNEASKPKEVTEELAPAPLKQARQDAPAPLNIAPETATAVEDSRSPTSSKGGLFSPIQTVTTILTSGGSGSTEVKEPKEPKPEKVKKAKNRMALEDSDASEDDAQVVKVSPVATAKQNQQPQQQPQSSSSLRARPHALDTNKAVSSTERLSESPIEVSPVASSSHLAPTSTSQLDVPPSPVSAVSAVSAVSTPELVERPSESAGGSSTSTAKPAPVNTNLRSPPTMSASLPGGGGTNTTSTKTPDAMATPSTSTMSSPVTAPTTPAQWSPSALRAYLEADGASDVRDLMLLVHDTSEVKGLPQGHELMRGFDGERKRLDGMARRLDDLLGEVLSRKSTPKGSPVSAA